MDEDMAIPNLHPQCLMTMQESFLRLSAVPMVSTELSICVWSLVTDQKTAALIVFQWT